MNARNVTVEDSYFFNTSLAALSSDVDVVLWWEGIATQNMTLRNSVVQAWTTTCSCRPIRRPNVTDCGPRCPPTRNTKFGESRGGMKGITIVNYTFYKQANWTCPAFRIASADDVLIAGNDIFLGPNDNAASLAHRFRRWSPTATPEMCRSRPTRCTSPRPRSGPSGAPAGQRPRRASTAPANGARTSAPPLVD